MSNRVIVLVVALAAAGIAALTVSIYKTPQQADEIVSDMRPREATDEFARQTDNIVSDTRISEATPYSDDSANEPESALGGEIEYEAVHGLRVRKDRNCTVTVHYIPKEDETVTTAYSCEANSTDGRDSYSGYSNETLSQMVYHDAKAAETLAMRLRDADQQLAMSLIVRASALAGGDARPIQNFSAAYSEPVAIDGQPVAKTIQVQYVLSAVVELLGSEDHGRRFWEGRVRASLENPDAAIEQFKEEAQKIIAEMRAIQREVTGFTTIRRGDENA